MAHVDERGEYVVLELRGELTLSEVPRVRRRLTKLLFDRGRVVVDVSGLRARWGPAVTVFVSSLVEAGGWPLARLVLVGADAELTRALEAARVPWSVPVAGSWAAAEEALRSRPRRLGRRTTLPATSDAVLLARAATGELCADWGLAGLGDVARLVGQRAGRQRRRARPHHQRAGLHPHLDRPAHRRAGLGADGGERAAPVRHPRAGPLRPVPGRRARPALGRHPARGRQDRVGGAGRPG